MESLLPFRSRLDQLGRMSDYYKAQTWNIGEVLAYDRVLIEALGMGCETALAHAEQLRMDTEGDQRVVNMVIDTLRIALGLDVVNRRS